VFVKPGFDFGLPGQVTFAAANGKDGTIFGLQPPDQRTANHAVMARDENTLAG
jgi:hypothetical protein